MPYLYMNLQEISVSFLYKLTEIVLHDVALKLLNISEGRRQDNVEAFSNKS